MKLLKKSTLLVIPLSMGQLVTGYSAANSTNVAPRASDSSLWDQASLVLGVASLVGSMPFLYDHVGAAYSYVFPPKTKGEIAPYFEKLNRKVPDFTDDEAIAFLSLQPKRRSTRRLKDVIGRSDIKSALDYAVPEKFAKEGSTIKSELVEDPTKKKNTAQHVVMFGPPGNGKTMLTEALANERDLPYFEFSLSDVQSKWFGQTSERMKTIREMIEKVNGSILFFDEIDRLVSERRADDFEAMAQLKSETLLFFDKALSYNCIIIGATNLITRLDIAVSGRRFEAVNVTDPDNNQRSAEIETYLNRMPPHSFGESETDTKERTKYLADKTEGLSSDDIFKMFTQTEVERLKRIEIAIAAVLAEEPEKKKVKFMYSHYYDISEEFVENVKEKYTDRADTKLGKNEDYGADLGISQKTIREFLTGPLLNEFKYTVSMFAGVATEKLDLKNTIKKAQAKGNENANGEVESSKAKVAMAK